MSPAAPALLLCDATLPVNFCKAGLPSAQAMADYLGDRVFVVDEVHEELTRLADSLIPLKSFLKTWPPNDPVRLEPALRLQVSSLVVVRPRSHPREDRGETATVVYAEHRRDEAGEHFTILTDDRWGGQLARDRGLSCQNCPQLLVEMVCASALSFKDGQRVWQTCFTDRKKWKGFREAVGRTCPEKAPAART